MIYLHLDLERLVDTIHSASEAVDYTTLGVSMGGFLAALTAPLLGAKRAICFAAQWSVSHAVVPDEHRWDAYVKNIAAFKHPTLAESLKHQEVDFHFFYGDAPEEVRHSRHIPDVSNVSLTVLKDCGHDVAWQLREEKKLYPVLSSILEGKAYIDVIEGE